MRAIPHRRGRRLRGRPLEPALELIETSRLDYICFECLAERTVALGQLERRRDPEKGYNPFLDDRWRAVLARPSSAASASSPTWGRPIRWRPHGARWRSPATSGFPI